MLSDNVPNPLILIFDFIVHQRGSKRKLPNTDTVRKKMKNQFEEQLIEQLIKSKAYCIGEQTILAIKKTTRREQAKKHTKRHELLWKPISTFIENS